MNCNRKLQYCFSKQNASIKQNHLFKRTLNKALLYNVKFFSGLALFIFKISTEIAITLLHFIFLNNFYLKFFLSAVMETSFFFLFFMFQILMIKSINMFWYNFLFVFGKSNLTHENFTRKINMYLILALFFYL